MQSHLAMMYSRAAAAFATSGSAATLYGGGATAVAQSPSSLARRFRSQQEQHLLGQIHLLESSALVARRQLSQGNTEVNRMLFLSSDQEHDLSFPRSIATSTLVSVAQAAELARPFSTYEETQVPVIGGSETFPMVLHRALAELECNGRHKDIAEFLPDGHTFQIKNQTLFEVHVLSAFFPKMKCFASFQRQLNLYDFKRVSGHGIARGLYRHDLFIRDNPALSGVMRRTKIKRRDKARSSSNGGNN